MNDKWTGSSDDVAINGGVTELTKELLGMTTGRGTTKVLKRIKPEFTGKSREIFDKSYVNF